MAETTLAQQTSEAQTQTPPPAEPATSAPAESAGAPAEVTDLASYTARVKARSEALRSGADESAGDKPRDEKGRFQKAEGAEAEPAAYPEAEASAPEADQPTPEGEQPAEAESEAEAPAEGEAEAEAAPAEPEPKQTKLEELRKKIESERARRVEELANKRRLEELDRAQPLLQGLQTDKLGTILQMVTPEEWERLCDMQIARLQGKEPEAKAQQIEDRLSKKLTEIEKREQQIAIQENQRTYGRTVETLISQAPEYPKVKRWLDEHKYDITAEAVDFANTVLQKHKYIPTFEQARDEIVAYVLGEIEISKRVEEGEKPAVAASSKTPTEAPKPKAKPRRTLNSTLSASASRPPEIQIRGKETFAEHIKARVASMKK